MSPSTLAGASRRFATSRRRAWQNVSVASCRPCRGATTGSRGVSIDLVQAGFSETRIVLPNGRPSIGPRYAMTSENSSMFAVQSAGFGETRLHLRDLGPQGKLHGGVEGHFGDSQRDTRVPACVAEKFDEQLGRAVEHMRLTTKIGGRMDIALHAHDLFDHAQAAHAGLDLRQGIDGANPRGVPAVLFVQLRAELALEDNLLAYEGKLAAGHDQIARADGRHVRSDGWRGDRQG